MSEPMGSSKLSRNDESALDLFFPSTDPLTEARIFSQKNCEEISRLLKRLGKESWSTVPRTYIVLRMINQLGVIDDFMAKSVSDFSFPFTQNTIPEVLKAPGARRRFFEIQGRVLSESYDLEKGSQGEHMRFSCSDQLPFHVHEVLGRGGYGEVHRITSKLSLQTYARKRFFRGKTFQKDREMLKVFVNELKALKKVSHSHITQLIGSYTDPKFVVIIMLPVADENLCTYMAKFPLDRAQKSHIGGFFGCLATALTYLHEKSIRHKDIKPQNILVKDSKPFLADFGLALDWSEKSQSTTLSTPAAFTYRYAAPEVASHLPRSSSSDVWSLGCVFLEMYTVILGKPLQDLKAFQSLEGSQSSHFWQNTDATKLWIERLRIISDHPILDIIQDMLQEKRELRPDALTSMNRIKDLKPMNNFNFAFCGACCEEDEDTEGSAYSSTDEGVDGSRLSQTSSERRSSRSLAVQDKNIAKVPIRSLSSAIIQDSFRTNSSKNEPERIKGKEPPTLSIRTMYEPALIDPMQHRNPPNGPPPFTPIYKFSSDFDLHTPISNRHNPMEYSMYAPPSYLTLGNPAPINPIIDMSRYYKSNRPKPIESTMYSTASYSALHNPPLNKPNSFGSTENNSRSDSIFDNSIGHGLARINTSHSDLMHPPLSRSTPSGSTHSSSTPSKPTPSRSTPSRPTPSRPTPSRPTPSRPTPSGSTHSSSTPSKPTPSRSTPGGPTPSRPAPSGPTSSGPASSGPAPSRSTSFGSTRGNTINDITSYKNDRSGINGTNIIYDSLSFIHNPHDPGSYNILSATNFLIISVIKPDRDRLIKALNRGAKDNLNQQYSFVDNSPKMALLHWAVQRDYITAVDLLLRKGADIEHYDNTGSTVLHLAAEHNVGQIASILLKYGARVNSKTTRTIRTPLHIAALCGSVEIMKLLLENGVEINDVDFSSETALCIAVRLNKPAIVKALINSGALYDATFWSLRRMKKLAGKAPNMRMRVMIEERMDETLLFEAARKGDADKVHELLAKGTNPMLKDCKGKTPYDYALSNKRTEVADYLSSDTEYEMIPKNLESLETY